MSREGGPERLPGSRPPGEGGPRRGACLSGEGEPALALPPPGTPARAPETGLPWSRAGAPLREGSCALLYRGRGRNS